MRKATRPVILWFRRDLRLTDHAPLQAAVKTSAPLILLYIFDEISPGLERPGAASRWWLHKSLAALDISLRQQGQQLIFRAGPSQDVIKQLVDETGATDVYFHHSALEAEAALESDIAAMLKGKGLTPHRFAGELLFSAEEVKTGSGTPFKVFTPFWRKCLELPAPKAPLPAPKLTPPPALPTSENLDDWGLLPTKPNWAKSFEPHWHPGEEGAKSTLATFLQSNIAGYKMARDCPAIKGTSRLSPHLHFGEISPRLVWEKAAAKPGADEFLREIGWREFCYHLLHHWPNLDEAPFKEEFAAFPWQENQTHLDAWQKGMTGYPIIDAGMRELWQTGWMHNRVRMIVASFLTKNLRLHWHKGRDWFWDTLVDADLPNNSAGWQWVSGSGADAAPYFRIFNPVTQSEKFDKEGAYIRAFVPELKDVPSKFIHDPSSAPKEIMQKAGVTLGQTYPIAIVDLKETRAAALAAYELVKSAKAEE